MDEYESVLEERFASLEAASRTLSVDVQGLTETLMIVAHLQEQQREQRDRQNKADRAIVQAKTEADARDARTRRTLAGVALAGAVLLPLVSILMYWALIKQVDELLSTQQRGFYASCMTRNLATEDNIRRERLLADADKDPAVKQIHRDSAAAIATSIVDCSKYLKK